jgi:hypothetical protein
MNAIEQNLAAWKESLLLSIPVGGLLSRNPVAYKWKAPFRAMELREAVSWRLHDLITQSYALHQQGHGLGARILLRSGFETLAILIYLNMLLRQVLEGELNFHDFGEKTSVLLLGSRDGSTEHPSLNIVTILQKCNRSYPGIEKLYGALSESAHPNYEGMVVGYSKINHEEYETRFSNRWTELYGDQHLELMELCMTTFYQEYNDVWPTLMEKLEGWVAANDATLEATKTSAAKAT